MSLSIPLSCHGKRSHLIALYAPFIALLVCSIGGGIAAAQVEYDLGDRVLSRGSWGADVFKLQQRLAQVGYDLVIDGHFGSGTQRVVAAFQLDHGLEPDGVVGPGTLLALESVQPTVAYIVQPGDSLWEIAQRFETTMNQLVEINNLPDGPLPVGYELNVPRQPTYKVRPGDTLSEIAQRFQTSVEAIATLNDIADPSLIHPGAELNLPRGAQAP